MLACSPTCLVHGLTWPKDELNLDLTRMLTCGLFSMEN